MPYHYKRPDVINAFKKQRAILDSKARYTVTEGSTKSGKTVSHIVWLFEEALREPDGKQSNEGCNYWWVAPIFSQAKIAFKRLKRFITDKDFYTSNESELSITLQNGSVIFFKSADNPDSLYGEDVYAAVFDEYTRAKVDAWYALRSTLTATKGRCKFIGNVKGTLNWGYELARKAEAGMQDWEYFKLTAADAVEAGVLAKEEIEDAERTLPKGVFLELYYGIPNENSSNKFCYSFDEKKHVGKCNVNYEYPIVLSFDFNFNPICCGVFQDYNETIYCCDLIKLENSNIYNLCQVIVNKYPDAQFLVTGDRSGKSHSAMVKDNLNYYKIIKQELKLSDSRFRGIMGANPNIEQNQVLVNAIFEHHKVQIDPDNAAGLIFDCKFAQIDNNKKLIKTDRNDEKQQLDALDCYRYYLNSFHSNYLKRH